MVVFVCDCLLLSLVVKMDDCNRQHLFEDDLINIVTLTVSKIDRGVNRKIIMSL